MEPRPDDGDDDGVKALASQVAALPQWSPALTTGTTSLQDTISAAFWSPQWSPALTTGTTWPSTRASTCAVSPQWSPALTTGTTPSAPHRTRRQSCRNGAPP